MPGRFITFEGGEGTGKSTLIEGMAGRLRAHGKEVVVTREPGGTPLAEALRVLALHPVNNEEWSPLGGALLMNAARSDHLDKLIRPALANGQWVLCDRFYDSTRVYQSVRPGISTDNLRILERLVVQDTQPDLTLILDAPYETTLTRRRSRVGDPEDVFERKPAEFHLAVREAFLSIARSEPERCKVVNAAGTREAILETAWNILSDRVEIEKV